MAKSSINIQLATFFSLLHNTRDAVVNYTIDDASRNSYDRNKKESFDYYCKLLKEATGNYTKRTGQRIQTSDKKFLWEAVVNLNDEHKLNDVKNLSSLLEKIYGWQSIHNGIHRDEGHIDQESGEKIYNYHGHIVLFMLNKEGIYSFKKRDFGIKRMVELQTVVANILNMERGISKKKTKVERLEHPQYRQVKQAEEKMEIKYNQQKKKLNDIEVTIGKMRVNKKKTASTMRKHKRQVSHEWENFRLFYMNLMCTLFKDAANDFSMDISGMSNIEYMYEGAKILERNILLLQSENLMLTTKLNNYKLNEKMNTIDFNNDENILNEYDVLADSHVYLDEVHSSEQFVEYDKDEIDNNYCDEISMDELEYYVDSEEIENIENEFSSEEFNDENLELNLEDESYTHVINIMAGTNDEEYNNDDILSVGPSREKYRHSDIGNTMHTNIHNSKDIALDGEVKEDFSDKKTETADEWDDDTAKELLASLDKNDPILESIKLKIGEKDFDEIYQSIIHDKLIDTNEDDENIDSEQDISINILNNFNF